MTWYNVVSVMYFKFSSFRSFSTYPLTYLLLPFAISTLLYISCLFQRCRSRSIHSRPRRSFSSVFAFITRTLRFVSLLYLFSYHPSHLCSDYCYFVCLGQIIQQVFTFITHALRLLLFRLSRRTPHARLLRPAHSECPGRWQVGTAREEA